MEEKYLTEFQKEIIDSDNKTTICNWSRGLGKTYTCARIITDNKPRYVLYCNPKSKSLKNLSILIGEKISIDKKYGNTVSDVKYDRNQIIISYHDGNKTLVFNETFLINDSECKDHITFDYILFDESLPYNITNKGKQTISFITISHYNLLNIMDMKYQNMSIHGLKDGLDNGLYHEQSIIKERQNFNNTYGNLEIFNNQFDILNEYDKIFKEDKLNNNTKESCLKEFQIKDALLPILQSLIEEYSAIEPKNNNVMTRKNILEMITDVCGVIYGNSEVTFGDVLNSISHSWDDISDDNKDSIYKTIGGERSKNKAKVLMDNIDK